MPQFSDSSKAKLLTCNGLLQEVFNELVTTYDCTIICGARSEEEQNQAYNTGKSKAQWGQSKHNIIPNIRDSSDAVDAVPYPVDWNNHTRFSEMNDKIQIIAQKKNIKIRWGGSFTKLKDLDHWELV